MILKNFRKPYLPHIPSPKFTFRRTRFGQNRQFLDLYSFGWDYQDVWWLDRRYKEKDDDHCLESWIYFWFQLVFYPPTKVFYPLRLLHIVIKVMYEGIGFPCLFLVWSLSKRRGRRFQKFFTPVLKSFLPHMWM